MQTTVTLDKEMCKNQNGYIFLSGNSTL